MDVSLYYDLCFDSDTSARLPFSKRTQCPLDTMPASGARIMPLCAKCPPDLIPHEKITTICGQNTLRYYEYTY